MAKDKSEKDKIESVIDVADEIAEVLVEEKEEFVEQDKDTDISISGADIIAGRV